MEKETYRLINTGLAGKKALEILQSVEGQLSDGMWENSPRMDGYWRFSSILEQDGKIFIQISNLTREIVPEKRYNLATRRFKTRNKIIPNLFSKMTDEKVKNWFANKIKAIVKEEYPTGWGKSEDICLEYLSYKETITPMDALTVYNTLKA